MAAAPDAPDALLTPRQLEVLELLARGLTNAEIAGVLGIAAGTAKNHVAAVLDALDVTNRTEAAMVLQDLFHEDRDEDQAVPGFGQRPSLALLPFDNMGPPEDEYVADGLVEDLTTALAAWRWFPVIARNSCFAYKGSGVDVRKVSEELGARYVLEGSTRRSGNQLRVNVQLIDGKSGQHHWAQRYDRTFDDLFAVQDEIVLDIVGVLEPALAQIERLRAVRRPAQDLGAWEWLQRGLHQLWRQEIGDPKEAAATLRRAVDLAPDAAAGWAALSQSQTMWSIWGECDDPLEWLGEAVRGARRAIELDPIDYAGHLALGGALAILRQTDEARRALERASELNPSSAQACFGLGTLHLMPGQQAEAIGCFEKALRLSPRDPMRHHFYGCLAAAHMWLGDYEAALEAGEKSLDAEPSLAFSFRPILPAVLGYLGQRERAIVYRDEILAIDPNFDLTASRVLVHEELIECLQAGYARIGWDVR